MTLQTSMRTMRRLRVAVLAVLLVATATPLAAPGARAATTDLEANCGVTLRAAPSTSSTSVTTMPSGTIISWTDVVPGGSWSATCGSTVAGTSWYAIAAVNGQPVTDLFGAAVIYAATGLFRPVDSSSYLEGVDVSRWQGSIDYVALRNSGKRFVLAKATEGIGFQDPMYLANRYGASSAGLAVTAYHFARPDLNPTDPLGEADWFVDNLGLVPGMLAPALDLEVSGTLGAAGLQAWVGAWLDRVYARTGIRPMIYASPSFWKKYLADTTTFADQGYSILWVAHWGVPGPTVSANNWSNKGWTFWQYTNCGSVPGITGCVDLDRYNGPDLTPVTFGADFTIMPAPATVTASVGTSTTFSLNFGRTFMTTPIDLSVTGLPAGATATFAASPVVDSATTMTVTSSLGVPLTPSGTYPLTVTAASSGLVRAALVTLTLVDPAPPVVQAPVTSLTYPGVLGTTVPVRTAWSAIDPDGIGAYGLQRQVAGGDWQDVALSTPTTSAIVDPLAFGTTYQYAAMASDGQGSPSDWVPGRQASLVLYQQTSSSIAYSGTWYTTKTKVASGGSLKYTTRKGASATYTFTGAGAAWVAYKGPNRGSAKVYVDGVYTKTISLYAKTYSARQIVYAFNWGVSGTHKIKIVSVGTAGHPRIDLDGFIRLTIR